MKILLVRLQIALIILLVFSPLLYLGFRSLAPELKLLRYDLQTKTKPTISPLHTSGKQILNVDNQVVRLRGVNLISTNWGDHYTSYNPEAITVAARDWHVNVIRTRLYQHEYVASPAEFFLKLEEQILAPARENNLYVIFHPWFGENTSLPDSNGIKMWLSVAKRYKDDPHIIYDLLAEPRDIIFPELESLYTSLIPKIRAVAPNSLIFVTGLDWGRDINAWENNPLSYPNLVYRSNPYNKTAEFPGLFGRIAEKYPVFLGEFGTDNKLSMTETDVKNILAYADKLNLGWTAWHFTSSGCPCLLSDETSFAPTPSGSLVKANLSGTTWPFTPPTFDPDPSKLYVYSDFLDSGFTDYSWGITNQFGPLIKINFHPGAGFYLSTSRRLNPKDFQTFNLTFESARPEAFSLRFKSWDNQLSPSYPLRQGQNTIPLTQLPLDSISGLLIEATEPIPDPTALTLDQIYFH